MHYPIVQTLQVKETLAVQMAVSGTNPCPRRDGREYIPVR